MKHNKRKTDIPYTSILRTDLIRLTKGVREEVSHRCEKAEIELSVSQSQSGRCDRRLHIKSIYGGK